MARDEPGLMLVPLIAFLVQLLIFGLGALALWPTLRSTSDSGSQAVHLSAGQWLVMVAIGVLAMFVSVVSHATIITRVMARFHGQSVNNTRAARAALTKAPQLIVWAFINYVVITLLRNIGNRGILGAIVGTLLRAGWLLASFFVVPVILFEDKGAVRRSSGPLSYAGVGGAGTSWVMVRLGSSDCRILLDVAGRRNARPGICSAGHRCRCHRVGRHHAGSDGRHGCLQRRSLLVCRHRSVAGSILDG